jgi:hypothetical protein
MVINTMKSKSMIMGSSRKIQYLESNFNILYDDVLLNDVKYEKLLGIFLLHAFVIYIVFQDSNLWFLPIQYNNNQTVVEYIH